MKFYFGRPYRKNEDDKVLRSHRIIIRKSKSNHTSNFSLWQCNTNLEDLSKLFKKIVVVEKEKYFKQPFKILDDWGFKRKGKSHYIIIQEFNIKKKGKKKSLCFGAELHDFDNDEIKEVLTKIFCNKAEDKEEQKNEQTNTRKK